MEEISQESEQGNEKTCKLEERLSGRTQSQVSIKQERKITNIPKKYMTHLNTID